MTQIAFLLLIPVGGCILLLAMFNYLQGKMKGGLTTFLSAIGVLVLLYGLWNGL
jgi:hypothetical protein